MAWDDLPPSASELGTVTTSDWTQEPPKPEELGSHYTNTPQDINEGIQDATVSDAMTVDGLAGLGKGLAGKALTTGMMKNTVPTIQRLADDELLKSTGYSAGQVRQLGATEGPEAARKAADYARNSGLGDVFSSQIGRENLLKDLTNKTGQQIGDLRNAAGTAPIGTEAEVRAYLTNKYGQGGVLGGKESGAENALEDISRIGRKGPSAPDEFGNMIPAVGPREAPTLANYSKASTFLNKAAANPASLKYPANVVTDAASKLSNVNDANIVQSLGSSQGADYVKALEDARNQHILGPFLARGEAREMAKRGGVGGLLEDIAKKAMDMGGHRAASKGLNALAGGVQDASNSAAIAPNLVKSSPAWAPQVDDYLKRKYADYQEGQ